MSTTWINRGHFYSPHVRPILVDCNFVVDSTSGEGVTSLKGQGISAVYMHSSSAASDNPNPASGLIYVKLSDNFQRFYAQYSSIEAPLSGSGLKIDNGATLTIGNPYVISILGDGTLAQWRTLGVPAGVTPAVGVSFIAAATGAGSGNTSSSRVQAPAAAGSGIDHIEVIGDPNKSIGPVPVGPSPNVGGWILLGCYGGSASSSAPVLTMNSYTPAGTNDSSTPPVFTGTPAVLTGSVSAPSITSTKALKAPADGSLISLAFYLNQSNVVVAGE